MKTSTQAGMMGLGALLLLIALVAGIAMGLDRHLPGQWTLAGIAAMGLSVGLFLLWEHSSSIGNPIARIIWLGIWILPLMLLLICRTIALSSP